MNWLINPASKKLYLLKLLRDSLPAGDKLVASSFTQYPEVMEIVKDFYQTEKHYPTLPDGTKATAYGLSEEDIDKAIAQHKIEVVFLVTSHRQEQLVWWRNYADKRPHLFLPISQKSALEICISKKTSYDWLKKNSFPTAPYAMSDSGSFEGLQKILGPLPWVAKPLIGGAGVGIIWVNSAEEFSKINEPMVLQPKLAGEEYTLNCYVDRNGKCRAVIPHRRWEVKEGEVSYGITVKNPVLMEMGRRIAEALPGAYGPLNFQAFHNPQLGPLSEKTLSFTDLNPRIGGGYPLCQAAGGRFVEWIILEAHGKPLPKAAGQWEEGVIIDRRDGNLKIIRKGFATPTPSPAQKT